MPLNALFNRVFTIYVKSQAEAHRVQRVEEDSDHTTNTITTQMSITASGNHLSRSSTMGPMGMNTPPSSEETLVSSKLPRNTSIFRSFGEWGFGAEDVYQMDPTEGRENEPAKEFRFDSSIALRDQQRRRRGSSLHSAHRHVHSRQHGRQFLYLLMGLSLRKRLLVGPIGHLLLWPRCRYSISVRAGQRIEILVSVVVPEAVGRLPVV